METRSAVPFWLSWANVVDIRIRLLKTKTKTTKVIYALFLAVLAVSLSVFSPIAAIGVPDMDVSDQEISRAQESVNQSKASLEKAKSKLQELNNKCSTLESEVKSIQKEIEGAADKAKNAQTAMLNGREALSDAILYEYKTDTISAYLEILLGSSNIGEFTNNLGYISQVMDHHSSEIRNQKRLRKELKTITSELNEKMEKQEKKLKEMKELEDEAQSLVDNLQSELGAKSKKLDDLRQYAESVRKANEAAAQRTPQAAQIKDGANPDKNDASQSTPVNDSTINDTPAPDANVPDDSTGWKSGAASAYGGSSDPITGTPARTATGAICDDNSMGVAIPMSWKNFRNLFGHTVVIQYNGKTVYATINDCGGMGGGSRHLDLQPGVFKALGFKTCQAWGVRTVRYRIL